MLWELQTEAMRAAVERHDQDRAAAPSRRSGDGSSSESATASTSPSPTSELRWRLPKRSSASLAAGEMLEAGAAGRADGDRRRARSRVADGDYFGPVLNRAGRMLAAAHGGQVLLSADAHAALAASESGWQAKALGEFRFKGIGSPVTRLPALPRRASPRLPSAADRPAAARTSGRRVRPLGARLRAARAGRKRRLRHRLPRLSALGRARGRDQDHPPRARQPTVVRSRASSPRRVSSRSSSIRTSSPLYDYWRDPDGAYLVMRWLRGGSLREALERGPWNLEPAATSARAGRRRSVLRSPAGRRARRSQAGERPARRGGKRLLLRLRDRRASRRPHGDAPVPTSSPAYVPPEELEGHTRTSRSDLYSLGLLTYELMTGRRPPMDGGLPSVAASGPSCPLRSTRDRKGDGRRSARPLRVGRRVPGCLGTGAWSGCATPRDQLHGRREPIQGAPGFRRDGCRGLLRPGALVSELISAVGEHRLVAVVGPSGIGKSSVVKAGLVPALRRGVLPDRRAGSISDMFPGSYPYRGARRRAPPGRDRPAGRPHGGARTRRARNAAGGEEDPPARHRAAARRRPVRRALHADGRRRRSEALPRRR